MKPKKAKAESFLEFQPDIVEIEGRKAPRAAELTLLSVVTMIVLAITWAYMAKVDRIVDTRGKLVTTAQKIVMQPIETGIVRTIEVRVGQVIQKGAVLATLDPTFADADVDASRSALTSLAAQVTRLEFEMAGEKPRSFSDDPVENTLQHEIFVNRKRELDANLDSIDAEIRNARAQMRTNQSERKDLAAQVSVLQEMEDMRHQLLKKEVGTKMIFLEAKNERVEVQRDLNRVINRTEELKHKIATLNAKRHAHINEHRSKIAQELMNARRERDRTAEQLKKMERRSSLVRLVAPADAVVLDIAQRSVGSVVRQAEPFLTLVPVDVPMLVEVEIRPQDIALLRAGDPARLKLDALPYQKYGTMTGRLDVLSEDTFKVPKGATQTDVYKGRLTIVSRELRDTPAGFRLIPGMSIGAEIKVGSRRLLSYFLYPIFRALDSSFREP